MPVFKAGDDMEEWLEHFSRNAGILRIRESDLPSLIMNFVEGPERARITAILGGVRLRAEINKVPLR